jgi:hypothetical protein
LAAWSLDTSLVSLCVPPGVEGICLLLPSHLGSTGVVSAIRHGLPSPRISHKLLSLCVSSSAAMLVLVLKIPEEPHPQFLKCTH